MCRCDIDDSHCFVTQEELKEEDDKIDVLT